MKKMLFSLLFAVSALGLKFILTACGGGNQEPPDFEVATFSTDRYNYNCFNEVSPLQITYGPSNNSTRVTVQTTTTVSPQLDSGLKVYGLQDPDISTDTYLDGCAYFEVPHTGEYQGVFRFIEGLDPCCPGPQTCWRWYWMQDFVSGFRPNCGNTAILVSSIDPSASSLKSLTVYTANFFV